MAPLEKGELWPSFIKAHADLEMIEESGKVRCKSTGHEMAPSKEAVEVSPSDASRDFASTCQRSRKRSVGRWRAKRQPHGGPEEECILSFCNSLTPRRDAHLSDSAENSSPAA